MYEIPVHLFVILLLGLCVGGVIGYAAGRLAR